MNGKNWKPYHLDIPIYLMLVIIWKSFLKFKASWIEFLFIILLGTFGSDYIGNHEHISTEPGFHFSLSQAKRICMWLFQKHPGNPTKDLSIAISFTDFHGIKKVIKNHIARKSMDFFSPLKITPSQSKLNNHPFFGPFLLSIWVHAFQLLAKAEVSRDRKKWLAITLLPSSASDFLC